MIWNRVPGLTQPKSCPFIAGPGHKPTKTELVGWLGYCWPGPGSSGRIQPGPKPGNPEPLLISLGGSQCVNLEMDLEAVIEWTCRCTGRLWSSEPRDALGGHDPRNLGAVIERIWRCTWRPRSSWTQRRTRRPRWSDFGDALGGRDQAECGDAVGGHNDVTQRCTW